MKELKNLIILRKAKGLTQADAASIFKMSRQAYSNYEIGNREPSIETLIQIAEYFQVSVDFILDRESPTELQKLINVSFNRIHDLEVFLNKSLAQYASEHGIARDTIQLWEKAGVIEEKHLSGLSTYFNVNEKYLLGFSWTLSKRIEEWRRDYREDYAHARSTVEKDILEIKYGQAVFKTSIDESTPIDLTAQEKAIITSYRNNPTMQIAVERLLGLDFSVGLTIEDDIRNTLSAPLPASVTAKK